MFRSGSQFAGAPFLRLLLPLCLGVSLPFNGFFLYPLTLLILLLIIWLILLYLRVGSFYTQPLWGALLFLTIFLFGVIRVKQTSTVFLSFKSNSILLCWMNIHRKRRKLT